MKVFCVLFAVALAVAAPVMAAEEEFSEVEYYKKLAEKQLAETQPQPAVVPASPVIPAAPIAQATPVIYYEIPEEAEPPANTFVAIPQYFHSRNDSARFKVGSQKLKMSKGHANGAGVTVLYNRRVTDWFSFALMYEYGFMNVTGGMAVPVPTADPAKEDSRWHSHVVGFLPEFTLGNLGKLQLSVIQGFDRASGHESIGADRRDIDDYGTNVTSLMAWWEKDFQIGCSNWKVTPYAGWRSLYVAVKDANVWDPAAPIGTKADDNMWVHLISGGLKASYQSGPLGMSFRGGVNHRTSKDDVPGYGNRAVAPGVVHFSHRANLDKTVGTLGANINYRINDRAMVGAGYDALFGKDTSAHLGSLNFILAF